ncbi:helix-turn-helix domain-containing protein [Albibacterium bauzanense]|uniref:AraC-like DNA-binding protein n=1 Tax=Albibacterium bauzanense TaxID=653929 RepID=A0A4R1LPA7_9SPHI|nr:helix-turn-helix domain-containing protein [Albibacterium bauzanense]TCK80655.1 AraC-like DNA-binding protein [Albibacterium bauzanense]
MVTAKNQIVTLFKATSTEELPPNFQSKFHTHIYCERGSVQFNFNNGSWQGKTDEFIFWLAGSEVSDVSFSPNFRGTVLLVEKSFLTDNVPSVNRSIDALLYSMENPVLHPGKQDKKKIFSNFQLLYDRSQETDHRFYEEALKLQMQLFLLEMWHIFAEEHERRKRSLQSGTLYERFVQLVQQHCMIEREVKFYADRLHITPKYLNQVCKANTSIPASQWIQRYTKERIILLLQNKNLSIAEIADKMNFSSYSFFTRYVKKVLGMSPRAYRKRI